MSIDVDENAPAIDYGVSMGRSELPAMAFLNTAYRAVVTLDGFENGVQLFKHTVFRVPGLEWTKPYETQGKAHDQKGVEEETEEEATRSSLLTIQTDRILASFPLTW